MLFCYILLSHCGYLSVHVCGVLYISIGEAQFPCSLCGVQFRNPNTLMAHKKHYCSKLASPTATVASLDQGKYSSLSTYTQVEISTYAPLDLT